MVIKPLWGKPQLDKDLDFESHPGKPQATNYLFAKFDPKSCFDISSFKSIQFEITAPKDSQMTFLLTQSSADCFDISNHTRLVDSKCIILFNIRC
jgi:hypothetical protein